LLTSDLRMANSPDHAHHRTDRKCWECHRETPHGRVNSLSSVPYARVPVPESPVPQWLRNIMNK
jgi:cytochrome c nitrite reductase small subunit